MNRMTDRKQARAMDLPDYPCPPSLGAIAHHAGSWGWFTAAATGPQGAVVAQDSEGYLWARSGAHLAPHPSVAIKSDALAVWTESGVGLYLPREAYRYVYRVDSVDELEWTPLAVVLKEAPGYALNFNQP